MQRVEANEYKCQRDEEATIHFLCLPQRSNVGIRVRFGTGSYTLIDEDTDFIRFTIDRPTVTVRIQYAFINRGSCENVITVVDNMPNNRDRVTARANAGATDYQVFRFQV